MVYIKPKSQFVSCLIILFGLENTSISIVNIIQKEDSKIPVIPNTYHGVTNKMTYQYCKYKYTIVGLIVCPSTLVYRYKSSIHYQ